MGSIHISRRLFTISFLQGKQIFWNTARPDPLHTLFKRTLDSLIFDLCFDRRSLLQIQVDTADFSFNRNDVKSAFFFLNTTVVTNECAVGPFVYESIAKSQLFHAFEDLMRKIIYSPLWPPNRLASVPVGNLFKIFFPANAGHPVMLFFGGGFLSDKDRQFNEQIPTNVGDDFLIYTFDPPPGSKWLESTSITVGRNSLLPVQMKIHIQDGGYDLFIFDYEAPEKPPEFFELPAIEAPNGTGQVTLDGEKVMLDIAGAPGLKTAIVRLHSESVDNAGRASYALDVTFITDEGFKSRKNDLIRLKADEAEQCGVGGGPSGGLEGWPDGKYRNIRFSPWLKPTDTEDTYIVEIRCRVETKTN